MKRSSSSYMYFSLCFFVRNCFTKTQLIKKYYTTCFFFCVKIYTTCYNAGTGEFSCIYESQKVLRATTSSIRIIPSEHAHNFDPKKSMHIILTQKKSMHIFF